MPDHGAFVLPAGVRLSLDGDALSIENAGDIVIEGAPAQTLRRLASDSGSVTISPPSAVSLSSISAPQGTVNISGKVMVDSIEAARVEFSSGTLKATVVKASESISVQGSKIEATVLVAPSVDIGANVKGSAMAVQSDNELGPHKLKGGFSLSEFATMMPNGEELLAEHDIEVPDEDDDDDDDDDDDEPDDEAEGPPTSDVETVPADELPAAAADDLHELEEDDEDEDDGAPDEVRTGIAEALAKIQTAYDEGDTPPPIALLAQLVADDDFTTLKVQINSMWSDLLKYHQKTGKYISNTVTHMFQTVQLLLRKVED